MSAYGIFEAKNRLSELVDKVSKGEKVTITRRGRPVARLVPPSEAESDVPVVETIAAIKKLRQELRLNGLSIRELIEEGRR